MAYPAIGIQGPFHDVDIFGYAMSFADVSDAFAAARVCKPWNRFSEIIAENQAIWKGYSESVGIPMVSLEGEKRNYRNDFRMIYSMTAVSGQIFRKIFGEPVGDVPCISLATFNQFSQPDPFDSTMLQSETWELVVEFPFVRRMYDESIPLDVMDPLDSDAKEPVLIPFTLKNRIMLCNYPSPVFDLVNGLVVSQCDYCPTKVNIYYQRKKVVNETIEMTEAEQKVFAKKRGVEVMPLGPRLFSDAVKIIQWGMQDRPSVRTSSQVGEDGVVYQAVIMYPVYNCMRLSYVCFDEYFGAAVGIPVEVL